MQGYIDLCLNVCNGKLWAYDINYKKKLDFRFKTDFIFDKKNPKNIYFHCSYLFPVFRILTAFHKHTNGAKIQSRKPTTHKLFKFFVIKIL